MPQIVEAAMKSRTLQGATPCCPPALCGPRGIDAVVFTPREHVIPRLGLREASSPTDKRFKRRYVQRDRTAPASLRLALPNDQDALLEVHLLPTQQPDLLPAHRGIQRQNSCRMARGVCLSRGIEQSPFLLRGESFPNVVPFAEHPHLAFN